MPPRRAARRPERSPRGRARPQRPRIRLETDQRRAQLLALAKAMFSDRSYDEVSIDDLARDAKISKGLLYHYFPTKRDLYVAGLREIADELVAAITSVPEDLAPIDRVRASLDAYLDHITRHARAYVSLMRGGIGSDPEVAIVVEGVRTKLFEHFLRGSPFVTMLRGNARFETAVRGWIGFVEAATLEWCVRPQQTRDELRELFTEILPAILRVVAPPVFRPT
ncbi:MAG TPA: TetR/AcrR family transcriptional regulator [Kofleriaceae bacterium]|nr:TetR/AcrR family transcriptional regulator [Kofleriaceae bacterium]